MTGTVRILCLALVLMLSVCMVPRLPLLTGYASSSGSCGANATYTLTDAGKLTISGTGAIDNEYFHSDDSLRTKIKSVQINNGITAIGTDAFYYCSYLASVSLPNTLTTIGQGAFAETNITAITIPASVTSVGNNAFFDCSKLTSLTFQGTSLGSGNFTYLKAAAAVHLPEGFKIGSVTVTNENASTYFGSAVVNIPSSSSSSSSETTSPTTARPSAAHPSPTQPASPDNSADSYVFVSAQGEDLQGQAPVYEWRKHSGRSLLFVIKNRYDDSRIFDRFEGQVRIDGQALGAEDYTARRGSLRLTVLPDCLETLPVGRHTIAVVFRDGTVTYSFTVLPASGGSDSPGTGESGGMIAADIAVLLAAAGAVYSIRRRQTLSGES
ncbi:MAG: leucine-rich repeat domain-containing protein [Clostridia bacterium]|nr:leucine-rich repeat domain-containing protein [Clostridia bacterium]MBQ1555883.1 leucine-rich repeat domain-containing protein [Clostridia bacterium]